MLFGLKKNRCSNTGQLLVWAKTKIRMQKTRDTFIASLTEAFWIPGSSQTRVLINCIFICRNKTRIKQASIHTNHFAVTLTVQRCHRSRHWAGWRNTDNYRLGTERHFWTFCFQLELPVKQQRQQTFPEAQRHCDALRTTPRCWEAAGW